MVQANNTTESVQLIPCSQVHCPKGTFCLFRCQPDDENPSNSTTKGDQHHNNGTKVTNDETCEKKKCPEGMQCQMETSDCTCEHCEPKATCVPKEDPCATVDCPSGSVCQLVNVTCITTPCNPIAQCQPISSANSTETCGEHQTYKTCSSMCEPSCMNKNPMCHFMCGRPACQCELGFYRDASGHCVSEQECLLSKLPVTSPPIWNNSNLTMPHLPMFNSSFPSLNFTALNSSMGCNFLPGNIPMELEDACKSVQCNGDFICRIIQRECYPGEPCIPGPECVPRGVNPPTTNCSMVRCSNGTTCQMVLFNPRNCYNSFCTYTERPLCVRQTLEAACSTIKCGKDRVCRLYQDHYPMALYTQPKPRCFRNTSTTAAPKPTCAHLSCPTNQTCKVINGSAMCMSAASTVPTQCGENEMYTNCVPDCQTSCRGVPECSTGIRVCHAGCVCKDGYRRNGKGQCVMTKYCYQDPGCKANESWTKCATCETKCFANPTCTKCYSGCGCDDGFARNSSQLCTTIDSCA
ncbi:hypothetical protein Q1695_004571 [Nippostrongylus brasiliensis]|nr:hypothetical protein Q1695_004571 [Nippostrongylus brasiliensis]